MRITILTVSAVRRTLSNANAGATTVSFNNGDGPGVWVDGDVADGGSRSAYESPRPPPEPEASRRGCPARDEAEQRGGPESEGRE
jgi:hypothetical protein